MKHLKEKVVRGAFVRFCAQIANFVLRLGSLMVLARLLDPKDFGLVAMVTAISGVLALFREAGLSAAAVQRATVTEEQASALFWINLSVGTILAVLLIGAAPILVDFYHEPRLFWIAVVLAVQFPFAGTAAQHSARLQRQMRFGTLALIDILALTVSIAVGVSMAASGRGYWALVGQAVALPAVTAVSLVLVTQWIPGIPRRKAGVGSLLRFGGTVTLNGLVTYIAFNFDKVLLGRFWGADALGIYGRAYQLVSIPTEGLYSSMSPVAMSGLSRLQDDSGRLKSYFLKGYSLVLAVTVPVTIAFAVLADDLILVVLGSKWTDVVPVFRLLAPTILVFGLINPLTWLLFSLGLVRRSLTIALLIAPLVSAAYLVGLPHGPSGVALAYSTVMSLWVIPHIAWCLHGTGISMRDLLRAVRRPFVAGTVAAALGSGVQFYFGQSLSPLPRLLLAAGFMLVSYFSILLFALGQKAFFLDLYRELTRRSVGAKAPATP